jgi:parvulin-like peptidyl-prolyl isomerase
MGQSVPVAEPARGQKPDSNIQPVKATAPLLDMPPERSTDLADLRPVDRIRVTVNGEAILDEEIRAFTHQLGMRELMKLPEPERTQRMEELWFKARENLIDREVVVQDAIQFLTDHKNTKALDKIQQAARKEFTKQVLQPLRKAFKGSEEDVREYWRQMGASQEMARRAWERQFMATEWLNNRVISIVDQINYEDMLEYYQKHTEEFRVQDSVTWQDIFIHAGRHPDKAAARRFAEVLASRIRRGEDFVRLAKQFDNGDSSLRENALGLGQKRGEIQPAIEAVLFQLKDGEVGTLVEMDNGFHIVRLIKRTYAGQMPFDDKVQKLVRDKLRIEIRNREVKKIITELRRKAIIEYARNTN